MFKKYTKKLFTRFLLIAVVPILILQAVLTYIFYVRHWENVHTKMEYALIGEIASVIELLNKNADFDSTKKLAELMHINIAKTQSKTLTPKLVKYKQQVESFTKKLNKATRTEYLSDFNSETGELYIFAKSKNHGVVVLSFSIKRIVNPTTKVFFMWMIGSATLLILVAVLFMKNQVRSILKLVDVADRLGKGLEIENFRPSGADEVRLAGRAFIKMKNRIDRQIYYRTQMLAHISHDLRTPLTRIRLQSEFIKDSEIANEINQDVDYMEEMIVDYLNFAKEEGNEKNTSFDSVDVILKLVKSYNDSRITFSSDILNCEMILKKQAFERAISNIIDNSLKFSNQHVDIRCFVKDAYFYTTISDDGIGIAKEFYKKVFKPFYKINESTEGFGLGLAIVKSVIYGFGGKIKLSKSSLGGLKVIIKLPR